MAFQWQTGWWNYCLWSATPVALTEATAVHRDNHDVWQLTFPGEVNMKRHYLPPHSNACAQINTMYCTIQGSSAMTVTTVQPSHSYLLQWLVFIWITALLGFETNILIVSWSIIFWGEIKMVKFKRYLTLTPNLSTSSIQKHIPTVQPTVHLYPSRQEWASSHQKGLSGKGLNWAMRSPWQRGPPRCRAWGECGREFHAEVV